KPPRSVADPETVSQFRWRECAIIRAVFRKRLCFSTGIEAGRPRSSARRQASSDQEQRHLCLCAVVTIPFHFGGDHTEQTLLSIGSDAVTVQQCVRKRRIAQNRSIVVVPITAGSAFAYAFGDCGVAARIIAHQ